MAKTRIETLLEKEKDIQAKIRAAYAQKSKVDRNKRSHCFVQIGTFFFGAADYELVYKKVKDKKNIDPNALKLQASILKAINEYEWAKAKEEEVKTDLPPQRLEV